MTPGDPIRFRARGSRRATAPAVAAIALMLAAAVGWANTNPQGGVLFLTGPAYWTHTVQVNAAGGVVLAVGPHDQGTVSLNAAGGVLVLNPLAVPSGEGGGSGTHTADQDGNRLISLSELLRVIQFYNSTRYGCQVGTEDGFTPNGTDETCAAHASDYNPPDWRIVLTELLRLIQFYNSGGYHPCGTGEDGYCPGTP